MTASVVNRQSEATECGLACLAMAAHMAGSDIDLPWLRQHYATSVRGATLADLAQVAGAIGMTARAVRCEPADLGKLQRPAILHWGFQHFVVLDRPRRSGIRIFDPAAGYRNVTPQELSDRFTGVALELSASPSFQKRRERSPLKLGGFIRWTPGVKGALAQALLLSVVLQVYLLAAPFYLQLAVDEGAMKGDIQLLTALAIGFGLFALFNAGAEVLRGIALQRVNALLSWDMSQRLFHHMVRLPLPWFQKRRLADTMTRFQAIEPIRNLVANGLIGALLDGVMAITTAVMMFIYSPPLAGITLAGLGGYLALRMSGIPLTMRYASDALQASIAEQGKRLETVRAIQSIKTMSGEVQREGVWANKQAEVIKSGQANAIATLGFDTAQKLLDGLVNLVVILLAVRAVIAGQFTIGALYAFLAYRTQFTTRVTNLIDQLVNWRLLEVYTHRLADIVLSPTEPDLDRRPAGLPPVKGGLELAGVAFRYTTNDPFVLRDISLKVEPGEAVAIVGPSGRGKSTLLKVLCGLYPVSAGEVRLDGLALPVWGAQAVRAAMGIVMQDDELLPGSIADNVTFFSETPDMDWMWECLRNAAVDEEVRAFPMQADTFVGDVGSALSGGQKQRLLIARALYKKPSILVLDEATSHLDVAKERQINQVLRRLSITRIVVAHRPETIAAAERVYLLHNGLQELRRGGTGGAAFAAVAADPV